MLYHYINYDFSSTDIMGIYPDKSVSQYIFFLTAILSMMLGLFYGKLNHKISRMISIIIALCSQTGFYIQNLGYIDEVFVNLVHPYNLFHHGKYSFQSDSYIDGTVEYFYYFLLTPFASTRESLLVASFILGWMIAVTHLLMVARILKNERFGIYLLGLMLTAFNPDLNRIFPSGFGNGLISLAFLYGIFCWKESAPRKVLITAAILPLIRIDAILYSAVLLVITELKFRNLRAVLITFAFSLTSIIFILLFSYFYYGHLIPTPIVFKSVPFKLLVSDFHRFPIGIVTNSTAGFGILIFPILYYLYTNKLLDKYLMYLFACFTLLVFISAFYYVQARINSPDRYYLPMFLVAVLLITQGIAALADKFEVQLKLGSQSNSLIVVFILLSVLNFQSGIQSRRYALLGKDVLIPYPYDGIVYRTFKIAKEAEAMNKIFPENLVIGSTELNTMGFFGNFKVDPLWGYANRQIAESPHHVSFSGGVRALPGYVINSKPDCIWVYHVPPNIQRYILKDIDDGEWYKFGLVGLASIADLADEFPNVFYISCKDVDICLIVPARSVEKFNKSLEKNGFSRDFERKLNQESIQKSSREHPLILFNY